MHKINETESGVPANAMGGSSSTAGTGGVDTYDPLLQAPKKKKLRSIVTRKTLEDIRGRSLNEAFIIVDEAQNFLPSHIKTCLSRVGKDSKICLIGDTKQTDLEVFRRDNGLVDAIHRLRNLTEVGVVEFEKEDIVRNSVIAHILDRYDD